jgi:hypothetical protein
MPRPRPLGRRATTQSTPSGPPFNPHQRQLQQRLPNSSQQSRQQTSSLVSVSPALGRRFTSATRRSSEIGHARNAEFTALLIITKQVAASNAQQLAGAGRGALCERNFKPLPKRRSDAHFRRFLDQYPKIKITSL